MSPKKKKNIMLTSAVLAIVLALFICWASTGPRALEDAKNITVNVNHSDGTTASFTVDTTARYLLEAMESCDFVTVGDTDYGARIVSADGEDADWTESAFWVYAVNGEAPEEGADTQPIQDGDIYDFYIYTY